MMTIRIAEKIALSLRSRELLTTMPPSVTSLAIGGSFAKQQNDELSDLDIFVIVVGEDGYEATSIVRPAIVNWIGKAAFVRGPYFQENFGHTVTLIYTDLSVVQVHMNTKSTLKILPMRRTSEIIYDADGFLKSVVETARSLKPDVRQAALDSIRQFWTRVLFASNALERGDLWKAIGYFTDMRVCFLRLERLRLGRYGPGVESELPASNFERQVSADIAAEYDFMSPPYDSGRVKAALRLAVSRMVVVQSDVAASAALPGHEAAITTAIGTFVTSVLSS